MLDDGHLHNYTLSHNHKLVVEEFTPIKSWAHRAHPERAPYGGVLEHTSTTTIDQIDQLPRFAESPRLQILHPGTPSVRFEGHPTTSNWEHNVSMVPMPCQIGSTMSFMAVQISIEGRGHANLIVVISDHSCV